MAEEGLNPTLIANAIGGGDPTDIRKKLIYAMLQGSTDTSPTNLPGGLNRIAQALLGNLQLRDLERAEGAGAERRSRLWLPGQAEPPPAANAPTSGPRTFGGPQEPPPTTPDVPFRPVAPLTNATPQPDMETALQVQRQAMADAPDAMARREEALPSFVGGAYPLETGAALAQMREGMQQGLGRGQPNSLVPPPPPPSPTTAFTGPQQPAGAPPMPGPPGQPPPVNAPPPTLPAPLASVPGARTSMTIPPDKLPILRELMASPYPKDQAAAMEYLKLHGGPETWKSVVIGDKGYRFSEKTGRYEEGPDASKPQALPQGSRLVDPRTGREIVGAQREDKPIKLTLPTGEEVTVVQDRDGSFRVPQVRGAEGVRRPQSPDERKAIEEATQIVSSSKEALQIFKDLGALNTNAYQGVGAEARAWVARNSPLDLPGFDKQGGIDTTQMRILGTQQALTQLKAIFGGQPAVKESEMLLQIQGSVNMSTAERAKLWERAARMAQDKLDEHQEKARAMRTGEFWKPGYNPPAGAAGGGAPVRVTSPEQARSLPSGTPIILPDGTPGRVP